MDDDGRADGEEGGEGHSDEERPLPLTATAPPETKAVKVKRKKKLPPIRINLSNCKYEILRIVQRKLGWTEVGDDDDWEVYWTDTSITIERVMKLTSTQKINHFNGMLEICRKRNMAKNLQKMLKLFPQEYDFFPRSFVLPFDLNELVADFKSRGKKQYYILKPDAGCQGKGIRLIQGGKEEALHKALEGMDMPHLVVQHYMHKPHLINGFKYDLRLYALVLSVDPLRLFIFHEGLARICTEKYCPPKPSNLAIAFMHLTNYAVNKRNDNFVANDGDDDRDASKWSLEQLAEYINENGHSWTKVWSDIHELVVKTLISVQPILKNNYRSALPPDNDGFSCFELLGYDVMLDSGLRPWLVEVNHSASFGIESALDLAIKEELITHTLDLVRVDPSLIAKTKKNEKKAAAARLMEAAMAGNLRNKRVQSPQPPGMAGKPPPAPLTPMAAAAAKTAAAAAAAAASAAGVVAGAAAVVVAGGGGAATAGGSTTASPSAGGGGSALSTRNSAPSTTASTSTATATTTTSAAADAAADAKAEAAADARAEVMKSRTKWEAKHSGGFTRLFPSDDDELQAKYERYLGGAVEAYASAFGSRNKKQMETAAEERKRKDEAESEEVKAQKVKARAIRDRLAQIAVERRTRKDQLLDIMAGPSSARYASGSSSPVPEDEPFGAGRYIYTTQLAPGPFGPTPRGRELPLGFLHRGQDPLRVYGGVRGDGEEIDYSSVDRVMARYQVAGGGGGGAGGSERGSNPASGFYNSSAGSGTSGSMYDRADRLESPPRALHPPMGPLDEPDSRAGGSHGPADHTAQNQHVNPEQQEAQQQQHQEQLAQFQQRLQQYYEQHHQQQQQQQRHHHALNISGAGVLPGVSATEVTAFQQQLQTQNGATLKPTINSQCEAVYGASSNVASVYYGAGTKQQHQQQQQKGALPPSSFRPQSASNSAAGAYSQRRSSSEFAIGSQSLLAATGVAVTPSGGPKSGVAVGASIVGLGGAGAATNSPHPTALVYREAAVVAGKVGPQGTELSSGAAAPGGVTRPVVPPPAVTPASTYSTSSSASSVQLPGEYDRAISVAPPVNDRSPAPQAEISSSKAAAPLKPPLEVADGSVGCSVGVAAAEEFDVTKAWVQSFQARSQTQQAAWVRPKAGLSQQTGSVRARGATGEGPLDTGLTQKLFRYNAYGLRSGGSGAPDPTVASAAAATSAAVSAISIAAASKQSGSQLSHNHPNSALGPRTPQALHGVAGGGVGANAATAAAAAVARPPSARVTRPTSAPHSSTSVRSLHAKAAATENNYTIHTSPLTIKSQPIRSRIASANMLIRYQVGPLPSHSSLAPYDTLTARPGSARTAATSAASYDTPMSAGRGALDPTTTSFDRPAGYTGSPSADRPCSVRGPGLGPRHHSAASPSTSKASGVPRSQAISSEPSETNVAKGNSPEPRQQSASSKRRVLTVHGKNMVIVDA